MLKQVILIALALFLVMPANAQQGSPATVVSVKKDRTGKRHANTWIVRCDTAGQVWKTGDLKRSTRKMFVRAGESSLRIGTAASPNSVGEMKYGTRIAAWSTLSAGKARDYGAPLGLVAVCNGPGTFHSFAEWYRKVNIFGQ